MNFALSPEAAASATFWHSAESSLRLLAEIAGLFLIPASHPCFAAWAAAEFVLVPLELELGVELLELAVDVLLLLLLPQPVTAIPPATTSTNSTMTVIRMDESPSRK